MCRWGGVTDGGIVERWFLRAPLCTGGAQPCPQLLLFLVHPPRQSLEFESEGSHQLFGDTPGRAVARPRVVRRHRTAAAKNQPPAVGDASTAVRCTPAAAGHAPLVQRLLGRRPSV